MTDNIEKQFFETFDIEKRQVDCEQLLRLDCEDCKTCKYSVYEYPEITDRILLELMCIFNQAQNRVYSNINILEFDVDRLKNSVLKWSIWLNKAYKNGYFKQQVQSLFKEYI